MGDGLSWVDLTLAVAFYAVSGHGITVGFHRCLTHGSFKANRAPCCLTCRLPSRA